MHLPTSLKNKLSWISCFALLLSVSCQSSSPLGAANKTPEQLPQAQPTSESSSSQESFQSYLAAEKLWWMVDAWKRFTADGIYRIAHTSETNQFVERGDFNHDNVYDDLAVIVVNTEKEDEKFNLIVFNAPQDGITPPEPHWLFRERTLSFSMSRWSGGLMIIRILHDGTKTSCYLNWKNRKRQYSCDKDYDDSHLGLR